MLVTEYLYNQNFTIQGKYFTTDECKCMHVMYDMHDPNGSPVEWSYDRSLRCFINHLQIPKCGFFEVGTSDVIASDVVPFVR